MMSEYIKRLKVDRYNLVAECEEQAQLFYDWGIKAAKAEVETKAAENDYELIKGRVEKKIRRNPENYGIDKITESAVKAEIRGSFKVKKYFRRYLDALSNEKTLKRAEKAFAQRKGMCESLATLNVQLHFAEPKTGEGTEVKREMDRSVRKRILSNLKKSKKLKRLKRRRK